MALVTKHGNYFEVLKNMLNLSSTIKATCLTTEKKSVKIHNFNSHYDLMGEYIDCMQEIKDAQDAQDKKNSV